MKNFATFQTLFIFLLFANAHFSLSFSINEDVIGKYFSDLGPISAKCSAKLLMPTIQNCVKKQKTPNNATAISLGGDSTTNETQICCQNVKSLLCVIHQIKSEPICKSKKVLDSVAEWKKVMEAKLKKDKCTLDVCKQTDENGNNSFEVKFSHDILTLATFVVMYFLK